MTEDKKQQSEINEAALNAAQSVSETEVVSEALKQIAKPIYSDKLPMINEEGKKLSRRFLGNIFGRGQEKKEFETYLKGGSVFKWQKSTVAVRQEYFYV